VTNPYDGVARSSIAWLRWTLFVSAVRGVARAGDTVVAERGVRCLFSFPCLGLVPDNGPTWTLAERIGPACARQLPRRPQVVDTREAFGIGLVDELIDCEGVELAAT
jgi:enoyl-CoA hydratase/carnithine racemase